MFAFKNRIANEGGSSGPNATTGGSGGSSKHGTWRGGSKKGFLQSGLNDFTPARRSIATQVDRDIALVLDRSGSMLFYQDEDALEDRIEELYDTKETVVVPANYWTYHYWKWSRRSGWRTRAITDMAMDPAVPKYVIGMIRFGKRPLPLKYGTSALLKRSNALKSLYQRSYSDNVIYQLERWTNLNGLPLARRTTTVSEMNLRIQWQNIVPTGDTAMMLQSSAVGTFFTEA